MGKQNGLNDAKIAWIISAYAITNTITTPFIPLLVQKFTRIKLLYLSTFLVATCNFIFFFIIISSFYSLIISAIIIRTINGFISGNVFTLIYSLTISLSEKNIYNKIYVI